MADVPPPNACSTAGSACQMPDGQAGTCVESTCSRPDYASRSGDGPMEFVEYPCNLCQPSGAAEVADEEADGPGESFSFCAVRPGSSDRVSLGLLLLAMAAWAMRRTRRRGA